MTKINKKCSKASHQKVNSVISIEGRNRQKVKKKRSRRKLRFCDLPGEILERILGNINTWRWNGIRATCKQLRDICDTALMHEFKTDLQKYKQEYKKPWKFVSLKVIHQATWRYIKAGYCPLLLGKILSLIKNDYPSHYWIKQYIQKFHKIFEESSCSQTSRLLYVSTLLGFLNEFKNAVLVSSTDDYSNYYCQLIYRLNGPWLWMLYPDTQIDRNEILVILAEIMIFVELEKTFMTQWATENKYFYFGNIEKQSVCKAKAFLTLTFDMHGSPKILSFLKNITSEDEHWDYLPKNDFNLNLRICSLKCDYQLEI